MRKYLELFTNGFDATIAEKTKVENWPYIGYSPNEGVKFTVIPEPYFGPANNEIWYTSNDGNIVTPYNTSALGANIISNIYEEDKGVITFDKEITSIGSTAFYYRPTLTSISIPAGVTTIEERAFSDCYGLASVTIPNSVTDIQSNAFLNCKQLTSVFIPCSVTTIGSSAFSGVTSVTLNSNAIVSSARSSLSSYLSYRFPSLTECIIGDNVTSIGNNFFTEVL